jgi:5-methylcytosine-specific restriction protein A
MPKITINEIEKIYKLAKQVYFNDINKNDALDEAEDFGINRGSAHDLITNFKYMYEGQRYTRTNNYDTTEYYLQNILNDFGNNKLLNAINALEKHIEYYEDLRNTTMHGLRKILQNFTKISNSENIIYPNEIEDNNLFECAKKQITVNAYERSSQARKECIEYYGYKCQICNFDFEKVYGDIGKGFIHVHHIVDISTIDKNYKIDPIKDLRPVCPNCHAMLHTKKPAHSIKKIKNFIE